MQFHGLEGTLVSHSPKTVSSLVPSSPRSCVMEVAGPAALMGAKVRKIVERVEDGNRTALLNKDAFSISASARS